VIRVAQADDLPAILDVHRQAFAHDPGVPRLVEELLDLALVPPSLSFVAVEDDGVVGHVMNSWAALEGSEQRLLQLSPLGVLPAYQRRGHGAALVRASLDGARELGEPLVLLEGDPRYYERFGFVRADELGLLPPPETRHDWAFQVVVLDESVPLPQGRVQYPQPFRR
jgi:putative acetyltransferase